MNRFTSNESGFTIIEVMLFLAVSGALAVAILASSSVAINSQRYRDATNTLESTLQEQYNQAAHVVNYRAGSTERCNATGVATDLETGGEVRGSSECLIMGRYVSIQNSGEMTLSNVVGYNARPSSDGAPVATTEIEELKKYDFFVDSSTTEGNEVAWGGTLTFKAANNETIPLGDDQSFNMVVLRSPLTGVARTFVYNGKKSVAKIDTSFIDDADSQAAHKICVDPTLFSVGTNLGVLIRERASSAGAIELLTEDSGC